ncbi:MAG: patatin-like phospholipase family protein [Nanoarchaeota archaeon]|nr:patatin-like phospholipase family protein [Nanoarchaeota archaeon]
MKKKIGLALSGGAIKGFAAIPIIQKLIEHNIQIDYVAGSSIGGIIGAYYCLYGEVDSFYDKISQLKPHEWIALMDVDYQLKSSLIKGNALKKYLKSIFGNTTFKDLKIKLIIPTTNLDSGKTEYITKGNLVDALMASSAYPGIFPPYKLNHHYYLDGGLLDNLPYEVLFKKKMNKVIALNLAKSSRKKKINPKKIIDVLFRLTEIIRENTYIPTINTNKKVFVFQPDLKDNIVNNWSISGIKNKYNSGIQEFNNREKEFLKWIK